MITSRLCCIIFIHCHRWTPWCMVIIIIICTGITVKLWRARIGLFSGGRPGDCDNKVKLPQWYTDYIVGILLQKLFKVECMHILKFLSFQDKTEFLKHTGNVSLLVISIVVLLHSLVHTPFVLSCMHGDVESNLEPRMSKFTFWPLRSKEINACSCQYMRCAWWVPLLCQYGILHCE